MNDKTLCSVGIDIGTTTTQLIFSELRLRNSAGLTQTPRYVIADRRILYHSPVAFTPLRQRGSLDQTALAGLIRRWYVDAGLNYADVDSGAAIVTGESLKAANARRTVMDLVDGLGNFVVATAGPHLESVLAGRGAGAAARSLDGPGACLNIDIGGGTANYAVFVHGQATDSACLNVGGRLIETDKAGNPVFISDPARLIVRELFGHVPLTRDGLPAVARRMADLIAGVALGQPDALAVRLLQTTPLRGGRTFRSVTLSGGVGACWREAEDDLFRYGDLGPLLADALREHPGLARLPLEIPEQTVRATVIGAGAWSLSLSGGTVWTDPDILPLRNVPAVRVDIDWNAPPSDFAATVEEAVARLDLAPGETAVIAIPAGFPPAYASVRYLAQGLAAFWGRHPALNPALVAVGEDVGKALGLELRSLRAAPLIVIDEVNLENGDYVDLGRPLHSGGVVPLTIKALAFPPTATSSSHKDSDGPEEYPSSDG